VLNAAQKLLWKMWINETGHGLDLAGSGWGRVARFCEHGDEPLRFIKGREFLD
jgi:hypothetical protein